MTVLLQDLKYPVGELLPSMFPDGDLDGNLQLWLVEAKGKTTDDTAIKAWVYYRGFSAVALRIANTPTNDSFFNDRTTGWSDGRVKIFQDKAREHLQVYNGLLASAGSKPPARMAVY